MAVHGQRAARGQLVRVGRAQDERTGAAHLLMQQADGVVLPIVGAEGIGADEFGQAVGLVGVGAANGAHLVQHHTTRPSSAAATPLRCLRGRRR